MYSIQNPSRSLGKLKNSFQESSRGTLDSKSKASSNVDELSENGSLASLRLSHNVSNLLLITDGTSKPKFIKQVDTSNTRSISLSSQPKRILYLSKHRYLYRYLEVFRLLLRNSYRFTEKYLATLAARGTNHSLEINVEHILSKVKEESQTQNIESKNTSAINIEGKTLMPYFKNIDLSNLRLRKFPTEISTFQMAEVSYYIIKVIKSGSQQA